jgi:TonB-dependent starch-binding outer membrane protein SusC
MKKTWFFTNHRYLFACVGKFLKIMKISLFLIVFASMQTFALDNYAQTKKMDVKIEHSTIISALEQIEAQSEFFFFYNNKIVKLDKEVSLDLKDKTINEILDAVFKDTDIAYTINNRQIILSGKEPMRALNQQQKSISGKVTDQKGVPLPGVSVVVKGTTTGQITDADGKFSLVVPDDAKSLVFSFIGMESQEISIGKLAQINVTMTESIIGLSDIVVVGYGTQSTRKITGAISNLNTLKLKDLPIMTSGDLMKGQIAGVSVTSPVGDPGTAATIRIRGTGSVGAGDNPLIVIDGFPAGNTIPTSLNPADIESFSILKDASSTAIYGARGSNGVIVITTKMGKSDTSNMQFSTSYGFQNIPKSRRMDVLNAREYAQFMKETITDQAALTGKTPAIPAIYQNPEQYGKGTNWQDELYRDNALMKNYSFSYNGGTDKLRGAMSAAYSKQDGVLPSTDFDRFSFTTNLEADLNRFIKAGVNFRTSRSVTNGTFYSDQYWQKNVVAFSYFESPLLSPYDQNGKLIPIPSEFSNGAPSYMDCVNPLWILANDINKTTNYDVYANSFVEITLFKNLKFKNTFGATAFNSRFVGFEPAINSPLVAMAKKTKSESSYNTNSTLNWNVDNLLTYERDFAKHHVKVLLGHTAQKMESNTSNQKTVNFPTDAVKTIQSGIEPVTNSTDGSLWSLEGFFARANYDYNGKYLLEATFRKEASSRFGKMSKWGNFPSFSAAWRVSDEEFFPKTQVNDLKIRVSYGITGNNNIGDFLQISSMNSSNYNFNENFTSGRILSGYANPELKWEKSAQTDIGIDISLFNYRVQIIGDYYQKITRDMLYSIPIPSITGFQTTFGNVGKVRNNGVELTVTTKNLINQFKWTTSFNGSYIKNKVLELNTSNDRIIANNHITQVGGEIGEFYGYRKIGIYNSQKDLDTYPGWGGNATGLGAIIYKDINKDGKITALDQEPMGSSHPDLMLGMTNTFNYKNFDFSFLLTSSLGYYLFNSNDEYLFNQVQRFNVSKQVINRWRSPEDPGDGLVPTSTINAHSRDYSDNWLEKADHLWVKNITLGYNVPESFMQKKKLPIKSVRVYTSLQNVFLYAPGVSGESNPEASSLGGGNGNSASDGYVQTNYPLPRIISFGLNINF